MRKLIVLILFAGSFSAGMSAGVEHGQMNPPNTTDSPAPQWEIDAGGTMAFDVASVKQDKTGLQPGGTRPGSNVPFGDGNAFKPTGGLFRVTNIPLTTFIAFAYKLTLSQTLVLATQVSRSKDMKWVLGDRWDIEARAQGNPAKDQYRMMMQSLLADRFELAVHMGTIQGPIYLVELEKRGMLGPKSATVASDTATPQWEIDAGGKMAFDVASVKPDKAGGEGTAIRAYSNIPFGDDEAYASTGGLLSVSNFTIDNFISFAYKLSYFEGRAVRAKLPSWARADRFDIEARGPSNATKDQMRLMMQSLLSDRFKLVVHFETHDQPIYNLVLAKAGQTGPNLTPYSDSHPCVDVAHLSSASAQANGARPAVCGGFFARNMPDGDIVVSSSYVTIQKMADDVSILPSANIDRPVIDRTGLTGKFDFTLQLPKGSQSRGISVDDSGPSFVEILRDQLGVKLESATGPVRSLIVDHIEEPSEN